MLLAVLWLTSLVIPVGAWPVKGTVWGADLSFWFLRQVLGALS
jgi:hypothetical protein